MQHKIDNLEAEIKRLKREQDEDNERANGCERAANELRDELEIERKSVALLKKANGSGKINEMLWEMWRDAEKRLAYVEYDRDGMTMINLENAKKQDFHKNRLDEALGVFVEFIGKLAQKGFISVYLANDD